MKGRARQIAIIDAAGGLGGFSEHKCETIWRTQMEKEIEGRRVITVDRWSSPTLKDDLEKLGCTIKEHRASLEQGEFKQGDFLYWIIGDKVWKHSFI